MATPAELQEQLRKALEESANSFRALTEKQMAQAVDAIDETRRELIDLLSKYADKDGSFKKNRIMAILKELDVIEKRILENGMDSVETAIKDTADFVANNRKSSMERVLGKGSLEGVAFDKLPENVLRYVATRFAADGLVLSDRVWQLSGNLRDQLGAEIRKGILQGQGLTTMIASVRRVYDNDTWKIRRLVLTESATAYRTADMYVAQQSKWVQAMRIHHGKADRPEHMCSILERTDKYGMGAGVFLATDTSIQNPHPNCTSWLEYVLDAKKIEQSKQAEAEKGKAAAAKQKQPKAEPKKEPTPAADPMAELQAAKGSKQLEQWAVKHLGVPNVSYKDYDDRIARQMNLMMYRMKDRYPEAFDWGMKRIATCQDAANVKYEIRMKSAIEHNLKTQEFWKAEYAKAADDTEREHVRNRLRDAIVKAKLIKKDRIDSGTNAFATTGGTGIYEDIRGIYINKLNSKDPEEFARKKRYAAGTKWSIIGTARGTMIHEYGHVLDYWLESVGKRDFVDQMWKQASQQDRSWWKENISAYGSTNDREMFAELFSEYVLSDNPRPLAQQFGKLVDEQVAKHRNKQASK